MAEEPELPIVETASMCRHLRSKGMYVYTDGQDDPAQEGYDNTVYWCLKTMKDYGPDDAPAEGQECRNPGRSCYEPI
jgi:hypothetical protein